MSIAANPLRKHPIAKLLAGAGVATLLLSACGANPGTTAAPGSEAKDTATAFSLLTPAENPIIRNEFAALAKDQCVSQDKALPLKAETVAQSDVVQKITLLASQDALPVSFVAGTAQVKPTGDLGKSGLAADYEKILTDLGVWDNILPAARSAVKAAYGGNMASLPYQFNVEGIFYNKKLLAEQNIKEPKTWGELVSALKKMKEAGVVPLTEAGSQGWPITRLLGNYIFRSVGPDALKDVQEGKAKLTDAKYVEAAQAIADLGAADLFGEGITSRDTDTANAQFLNGQAAMTYNGSWMLANINDPKQNKIGAENVGFMPFPAVDGGAGNSGQWPANAGAATALSAKSYGPKVGDWLTCVAENYGSSVMKNQSVVSGFRLNTPVENIPPLTAQVQGIVGEASETLLWFEALFDAKTTKDAQTNVSLLVTGQMAPKAYMELLQAGLGKAK
ncbi:ABC transporter substrate-binding protein [Arthrobacter sp. 35W]|uniref:ABC transporter substrate-binding protein n=1 Tax=Arthrobacter sp. 35W TaxID=1132441 RepID=UPI00041CA85A|nr:extracellular solute-binding protein [Arthrobacter sp. 35W]